MLTLNCADKSRLAHPGQAPSLSLNDRSLTLPRMFQESVGRFPRHTALIYRGRHITYAELQFLVRTFAITLTTLGVKKGDVVCLWLPNTVATVVAYYASLTMGAVVMMADPLSGDDDMIRQVNASEARLLITLDILVERAVAMQPKTPIRTLIHTSLGDYLPAPLRWVFPLMAKKQGLSTKVPEQERVLDWNEAMALKGTPIPEPFIHPEEVAVFQYIQGITGQARGALLTHADLTGLVQAYKEQFQLEKGEERVLGAPPIYQMSGMAMAMNFPILMGWTSVLVPNPRPKELLSSIRKFKPSMAPLVSTMLPGLLKEKSLARTDMRALKLFTSDASSLPQESLLQFRKLTGASINETPVPTLSKFQ